MSYNNSVKCLWEEKNGDLHCNSHKEALGEKASSRNNLYLNFEKLEVN